MSPIATQFREPMDLEVSIAIRPARTTAHPVSDPVPERFTLRISAPIAVRDDSHGLDLLGKVSTCIRAISQETLRS